MSMTLNHFIQWTNQSINKFIFFVNIMYRYVIDIIRNNIHTNRDISNVTIVITLKQSERREIKICMKGYQYLHYKLTPFIKAVAHGLTVRFQWSFEHPIPNRVDLWYHFINYVFSQNIKPFFTFINLKIKHIFIVINILYNLVL